MLTFIQL